MPKRTASRKARPRVKTEHNPCQHAVPGTNCASRRDRDRGKALAPVRGRQQRAFGAERQHHDFAAALFDDLARRLFLIGFGADLPPGQILQLAQARLQHIDAAARLFERRAGGIENQPLAKRLASVATRA